MLPGFVAEPASRLRITPREAEVATLMLEGLGNKGIAARLGISQVTVSFHLTSVYRKTGAQGRVHLVRLILSG